MSSCPQASQREPALPRESPLLTSDPHVNKQLELKWRGRWWALRVLLGGKCLSVASAIEVFPFLFLLPSE